MNHTITKEMIEKVMDGHSVDIASSSNPEGVKRLHYNFDRAMYVLTVNEKFAAEASEPEDAAKFYNEARI